jgi:hypothetical protein
MTRLTGAVVLAACALSGPARAQPAPDWRPWDLVAGEWIVDEGGGQPGAATVGSFSFAPDLERHVLVRRDHSEYAATTDRPAARHDGLMIIYAEQPGRFAAISFDNEGHVIQYAVDLTPARIVLTSPVRGAEPRYRLTYEEAPNGLRIAFAIAPPNQPDAFAVYVEGTAHRAPRP